MSADRQVDAKQFGTWTVTLSSGVAVIGHVVVDSGAITANAGTNLNTSALALEAGGNLALIKAKTDNLDSPLSGIRTDLDKIPSQGAAAKAASMPVNIASDQTVPVSAASLPLPANAAIEAGGNMAALLLITQTQIVEQLKRMTVEMRIQTDILAETLNFIGDVERLRSDPYYGGPAEIQ